MQEEWKRLKDYGDRYLISNYGRVKSNLSRGPKSSEKKQDYKIIKPGLSKKSNTTYERIELSLNGKRKKHFVHRLVAKAFISNPKNYKIVNHIDNNGLNNHHTNLEWCTQSENCLHSQNQGRMTSAQSKGGQAAGHRSNNKSLIMINSYIGKQINDWTVLSIDKETIELNKPRRVICKCMRCSSEQSVLFHSVKTGRSKMCKSCAQKQRHLDKINIQTKI